ncbi:MAG: isoprenylcysteine carboxylmethyltransferase family protein [Bradyrhizobiaceae bacterium]|nr:isoprenylcysteine carboxylmethyltransferase family protein [Bradyrhizobiaceae bacterium]
MTDLEKRALVRAFGLSAFVGLLLLVSGGPDFRQGLHYWIIFTLCSLAITLYFLQHDPGLIERRLSARTEKEESQEMIRGVLSVVLILLFVVAGIDHRMGWSGDVPATVATIADAVMVLGFAIVFLTFQANSHAGAIVDVTPDQQVVSSGPYALVRHPMYLGGALILLATPFALGSEWAFPWALAAVACLAWRLMEEERYLSENLPGYDAYRQHTRYRLIPYVW